MASRTIAPLLGMLVDRSSFDETDDFGVNKKDWFPGDPQLQPAAVMRNGRVRRRLRWRPHKKRQGTDDSSISTNTTNRSAISNQSITSRFSSASRTSKKSEHSFGSMATQKNGNTKKDLLTNGKFPLPRLNYPTSLDGSESRTIANEGQVLFAETSRKHSKQSSPCAKAGSLSDSKSEFNRSDVAAFQLPSNTGIKPSPIHAKLPRQHAVSSIHQQHDQPHNDKLHYKGLPPRKPGFPPEIKAANLSEQTLELLKTDISELSVQAEMKSSSLTPKQNSALTEFSPRHAGSKILSPNAQAHTSSQRKALSAEDMGVLPALERDELERECRVNMYNGKRPSTISRRGRKKGNDGSKAKLVSIEELRFESVLTAADEYVEEKKEDDVAYSRSLPENFKGKEVMLPPKSDSSSSAATTEPLSDNHPYRSNLPAPSRTFAPVSTNDVCFIMENHTLEQHDNTLGPVFGSQAETRKAVSRASVNSHSSVASIGSSPVQLDDGGFIEAEKNLQAMHEMASIHLQHCEYDEALEVFEEILRGQLARYGKQHFRIGTALHNIGIVYMKREDFARAIEVYKNAVAVRKSTLTPDHVDVAASLAQLGVAYLESDMHKRAISVFREALKIRRKTLGVDHLKVAKILNNIGCALYELRELKVAKVAFEEALAIQKKRLRDIHHDDEPNYVVLSIAATLCNLSSIKQYYEMYDEARADLEEALLIQQRVYGNDHLIVQKTK
jgi:tetratricopeptide (TPR) repeat protein